MNQASNPDFAYIVFTITGNSGEKNKKYKYDHYK